MGDLRELYQEMILDHGKHPRNCRALDGPHHEADGHNPLCGDRLKVFARLDGDKITEVSFQGNGCAISMASASMMTQALEGKTLDEATQLLGEFTRLVRGEGSQDPETLGKLVVFGGVSEFPVRVKCATLPWHTLKSALSKDAKPVSTE